MAVLKDWLKEIRYSIYKGTDTDEVTEVVTDSRKAAPGTVFVCIAGSRNDGHRYIGDASALGCRNIVAERVPEEIESYDVNVIVVPDTKSALSLISAARFGHPADKLTLIGITGTKGKTSSTYMFKKIFDEAGIPAGVIGTNGCVIGDERIATVNTTPDACVLNRFFNTMVLRGIGTVIMECSSQGFKLMRTAGLRFRYGIFLNISPDHIGPGEHEDFSEYIECKKCLMKQSDTAVINISDTHAGEFTDAAEESGARIIRVGIESDEADLSARDLEFSFGSRFAGTSFRLSGLSDARIELSIPGDFNVANALPVIAVSLDMGFDIELIARALKDVHVDGRMETVYSSDRFTCIVDYAHNGISMENLARTLKSYGPGRIVVVFGCGGNRSKERRRAMGASAAQSADFCIITSDNSRFEKPDDIISDIAEAYLEAGGNKENMVRIPDRREAIRYALGHAAEGDIIAVIGKGHEDYQEENGVKYHFLDKEEILRAAEELKL